MPLTPGREYSNQQMADTLQVSTQGGIRYGGSLKTRIRVAAICTGGSGSPYRDRWIGSNLVYTGEGLRGDQRLHRGNLVLVRQMSQRFPLHAFEKLATNTYRYVGLMNVFNYGQEKQVDADGRQRNVYIFELRGQVEALPSDREAGREDDALILERVRRTQTELTRETVSTSRYRRSRQLASDLRALYGYTCQLCGEKEPAVPAIEMHGGHRYVEVHHIKGFAEAVNHTGDDQDSGDYVVDDASNLVVLCCYHHKVLHHDRLDFRWHTGSRAFVSADGSRSLPLKINKHL